MRGWPRRSASCDSPTILRTILYWVAVVAISLALLVALVLFIESRDSSTLGAVLGS